MKLRFYRRWYSTEKILTTPAITTDEPFDEEWEARHLAAWRQPFVDNKLFTSLAVESAMYRPYAKFLITALERDFHFSKHEKIDDALTDIAQLERGEIEIAYAGGAAFNQTMNANEVSFEHSRFSECEIWPIWKCPLVQYKAALWGWLEFFNMPSEITSELIVELPDLPVEPPRHMYH